MCDQAAGAFFLKKNVFFGRAQAAGAFFLAKNDIYGQKVTFFGPKSHFLTVNVIC